MLTNHLEIVIIEIPKALRIYEKNLNDKISQWMVFFDNPNRKEKLRYPNMDFWKIVSEYPDVKVFIGPDAHKPETVSIDYEIEYALSKVKEFNLNLQTRIKNH